jgi:hypothetical protein
MKGWEHEKQRREQEAKNQADSMRRSVLYSPTWEEWTPEEAARYFPADLGPAVFARRTSSPDRSKIIYTNRATGWKLVVDVHGRYFTILRPWLQKDGKDSKSPGEVEEWYVAKDRSVSPTGVGPAGDGGKFHFRIRRPNKTP